MRIVLAAAGSRGDAVPFGALAARLQGQGHEVVLLTHTSLREAIPTGVPVRGVPSDPEELLAGPAATAVRRGDIRALNRTRGHFADFLASFAQPTAEALSGADVLVASTFAVAAVDEALNRGVPVVRGHLWPESPRLDGPMPLLPLSWALPAPVRRSARRSLRHLEGYLAGFDGWWERGRLQLHAHHPAGFTTGTHGTMHAVSPRLVPPGDVQGQVTGWWVAEEPPLADPLAARLARPGDRWVYVGFGSMHQPRAERLYADVTWAAERLGVRAVVQLPGAEGLDEGRVLGIGEAPHEALFARVALAVHHGGSGTTASAVRSGVPSVVVPHFADQYYWAHRLREVGVAPRALPHALVTRERLVRAMEAGLDPARAQRAAELGVSVREEDGTGVAARYVVEAVQRRGR